MTGQLSRRRFVQGLAAGGVVTALGRRGLAWARPAPQGLTELGGTSVDLTIGETPMNITGAPRLAQTINGTVPGPLPRLREGDTVTLRVRNTLDEDASIHWHGLILPANMDGVPGLSFHGIRAGDTYTYQFRLKQHGTYWYHSHSGFQEQRGVYAPMVIEPRDGDGIEAPGPMAGLLLMLASCTGADIVGILEKMRALPARLRIEVRGTRREEHPRRYTDVHLVFVLEGGDAEEAKARRAVELSLERYCSVVHSIREDIRVTHELRLAAG